MNNPGDIRENERLIQECETEDRDLNSEHVEEEVRRKAEGDDVAVHGDGAEHADESAKDQAKRGSSQARQSTGGGASKTPTSALKMDYL